MLQYVITAVIVTACVIFVLRKLYLVFAHRCGHNPNGCGEEKPCAGCDDTGCPFAKKP